MSFEQEIVAQLVDSMSTVARTKILLGIIINKIGRLHVAKADTDAWRKRDANGDVVFIADGDPARGESPDDMVFIILSREEAKALYDKRKADKAAAEEAKKA